MENNTLHMKLYSAASLLVIAAAFGTFSPSTALAKVCFLPDCENDLNDINMDISVDDSYCSDNGFSYNRSGVCPLYYEKESCPRDPSYIKCDAKKWCENNGYLTTSCTVPEYLSDKCPNGLEMYKECKADYKQACEDQNPAFTDKCQNGWQLDNTQLCTYSPTFGICCNKCEGFEYTADNIPQGYIAGERCDSCVGARYKKIINPCTGYSDCTEYGPATGSLTCWSGTVRKYKTCETCGYTITLQTCNQSCLNPSSLSCTRNGTIYYSECATSKCTAGQICSSGTCACEAAYKYTCSGTGYKSGVGTPCYDKYTSCNCSNGYSWANGACMKQAAPSGYCCDDGNSCGRYSDCKSDYNFPDCSAMVSSCRALGGRSFTNCYTSSDSSYSNNVCRF